MEEMLENGLDVETGMRRVRVVADGLIEAGRYEGMIPPAARGLARVEVEGDPNLGLHFLRMEWPARDVVDFGTWPKPRRLVVWTLTEGERVRGCIEQAAGLFEGWFGGRPGFALVGVSLPSSFRWWEEEVAGCMVSQAEWIPRRCVAVGGRVTPSVTS